MEVNFLTDEKLKMSLVDLRAVLEKKDGMLKFEFFDRNLECTISSKQEPGYCVEDICENDDTIYLEN